MIRERTDSGRDGGGFWKKERTEVRLRVGSLRVPVGIV